MGTRSNRRGRKTAVINVREILRLAAAGFNQNQIAQSCNIARSTVQDYLRRAEVAALGHEQAKELDDEKLMRLLGKDGQRRLRKDVDIDFEKVAREIQRKGVTLELVWQEEVIQRGFEISYSTFCRRFKSWSKSSSYTMRQDYKPGDKAFVDYAGLTLPYIDGQSAEPRRAQIFVACLGASDKIFAEATANQKVLSWIGSHCRACDYFGGVPAAFVPDNLKSGVRDPWWYEPEVNRSYQDFAEYYQTAILPTRILKPRDKAKVEKAVQEVERWIIAPLRDRIFSSIKEINEAIAPLLRALNTRKMRRFGVSRDELFEQVERSALRPLPPRPYQTAQWKKVRVHPDYHVEFERHYYSVPYYYVRQEAWLKASEKLIEVYVSNQRVAFHRRSFEPYSHTTLPEHMPSEHREVKSWTAEKLISWSKSVGPETLKTSEALLATKAHPEQAFRAILGLRRLSEKYSCHRLEAACRRANHFKLVNVRSVRSILEKGWEKLPLNEAAPDPCVSSHENLRGPTVYH
ncbi:MAG: IS21 family transposase [Bdellovibrionales bacterium]|nr:IS21 family transposase [Bdellovibrionales bacterium]